MSAPTPALLIDHALGPHLFPDVEPSGYLSAVSLATGTRLLWVGSSFTVHHSGGVLYGSHVLQVLNGDLRGECVEVRVDEGGREDRLPDAMRPAGETQFV